MRRAALATRLLALPALLTLLTLLTLLATVTPRDEVTAQRRPDARRTATTLDGRHTLVHDGRTRAFVARVPRGLAADAQRPLVLVLHGGGGNAANVERMTGFTRLVDREDIIVVYPEGTGPLGDKLLTWNAGHCCGAAMRDDVDDVGFLGALLDTLIARWPVDPRRVYVTGMSNGAMMTHRVARELSARITAIGPVVGAVFGDEPDAAGPVPMLAINGLLDRSVPPEGGTTGGRQNAWDAPAAPNLAQGAYWARAGRCAAKPVRREDERIIRWRWPCPDGRTVEVWQVTSLGHAWPGGRRGSPAGDDPGSALVATEALWRFFRGQVRVGR